MNDTTATPLPAVEVPEAVKVEVEYRVAVQSVQRGDIVAGSVVGKRKTGPKWTVLETADEKRIVRLENDTEIPLVRVEETEESKATRFHAMKCERIVDAINDWKPAVPAVLAKMNEQAAKGYVIGYSEMGSLATAQADDIVWARYCAAVRHQMLDAEETVDAVTARERYIDNLRDQIVSKAQYQNNRSSNAFSNLIDDENLAAMARFIERGSWYC